MFGAIAGGIASALAGGAMSKLFGGGQKAASGGIQGDVLATDNNTVGMGPEGDEKWFLENEKTVTQFCRKLAAERPLKDIRDEYNYPKKKGIKDECSRLLEASTMKSRRGFAIQRLMNAM